MNKSIKALFYVAWPLFGAVIMLMTAFYSHASVIAEAKGWLGDESIKGHYVNAWPGGLSDRVGAVGDWLWTGMGISNDEKSRRLLKVGQKRLDMSQELMSEGRSVEASMAAARAVGYLQKAVNNQNTDSERWLKEVAWSLNYYDQILGDMENTSPEKIKPRMTELRYLSALTGEELGVISK